MAKDHKNPILELCLLARAAHPCRKN